MFENYEEALQYLKETGNEHLIEKELSIDGWTVIALANSVKTKHTSDGGVLDSTDD